MRTQEGKTFQHFICFYWPDPDLKHQDMKTWLLMCNAPAQTNATNSVGHLHSLVVGSTNDWYTFCYLHSATKSRPTCWMDGAGSSTTKQVQYTQGIVTLSGFIYRDTGNQGKWSHEAGYQLTKITQDYPSTLTRKGRLCQHQTNHNYE